MNKVTQHNEEEMRAKRLTAHGCDAVLNKQR